MNKTVRPENGLSFNVSTQQSPGPLTDETMNRLKRFFEGKCHQPSLEMWEALKDLASSLESMALGQAKPKLYLSSLDPGVGKTQTIIKFIDSLLSCSRLYQNVGVILCLNRLSEIEKLADGAGIPKSMLAVLTSDNKVNALGDCAIDEAQILITTQQMVEKRLVGLSFSQASDFYYRGKPRAVRIWDESYLPGEGLTLNIMDVGALFACLESLCPKLLTEMRRILDEVCNTEDGGRYAIPDFEEESGISLNDLLETLEDSNYGRERERAIASKLWLLSGKMVSVNRDKGRLGQVLIDYRETLPEDLAPTLILDASGRCRETYRDMEEGRQTLVRLKTAIKKYDALTLNVWQTGGGKSAWKKDKPSLIEGIARTVNANPDEKWLIVYHKKDAQVGDIKRDIKVLLADGVQEKVSFITWGEHMATNAYVDCPNVILAGTLFYRTSSYEALKRLSANRRAIDGPVTKEEMSKFQAGEHNHLILQALCRGAVRKCQGEYCHPMNAYIIASVRSGIVQGLPGLFPGSTVKPWQPILRKLNGKVQEAISYLEEWLKTSDETFIKFSRVSKAIGMTPSDFRKRVRLHPDFQGALYDIGLTAEGDGRKTGFFRGASVFIG